MHYFDVCHWLYCIIGSRPHKCKPGEEGRFDSKTTLPTENKKKKLPLIKDVIDSLCVFMWQSIVVWEYGLSMDWQISTPSNSVIIIQCMDVNKTQLRTFHTATCVFSPANAIFNLIQYTKPLLFTQECCYHCRQRGIVHMRLIHISKSKAYRSNWILRSTD